MNTIITYISSLMLFFMASTGIAHSQLTVPSGDLEPVITEELAPQLNDESYYNEVWSYHLFLENEMQINLILPIANFGRLKSPVGGARLSITGFKGNKYQVAREFPFEYFIHQPAEGFMSPDPGRNIWAVVRSTGSTV